MKNKTSYFFFVSLTGHKLNHSFFPPQILSVSRLFLASLLGGLGDLGGTTSGLLDLYSKVSNSVIISGGV